MARRNKKRSRYHHGDLRRTLIREAVRLIRTGGDEALSLREAARRAGVSQTAPYRHFADKQALVAAVAEEGFRTLMRSIRRVFMRAAGDPAERLRALGVEYVRFAMKHPAEYHLMFGTARPPIEKYPTLHEAAHAALGHVLACLSDGQRVGCIRTGDLMELTFFVWTHVHGLVVLLLSDSLPTAGSRGFTPEIERLTDLHLNCLFHGLTPRRS
ncbi:MAG: TetR/AcrR family transcriptional regulator [Vicinamibacteria bacterium]|nr:TetR/AcrR family transcriptional regulator [Vicinamibacteria bacterium]